MNIPWTCPKTNGLPDASANFDERTRAQAALHDAKGAGRIHPWPSVPVTLMQAQRERWLKGLRDHASNVGADPRVGPLVLEIGCHRSGVLESFATKGWAIAGVDVSRSSIEEHHAKHPGCFAVAPAEHLPLPEASVDLVLAIHVLEHVSDRVKVLAEIMRVLKAGERAFIEVPVKDSGLSWEGLSKAIDLEAWKRAAAGAGHEYDRLPASWELLDEVRASGLLVRRVERGWRWAGPLLDRLLNMMVRSRSLPAEVRFIEPSSNKDSVEGFDKSNPLISRRSGRFRLFISYLLRMLDVVEHQWVPGVHGGTLLVEAIKP